MKSQNPASAQDDQPTSGPGRRKSGLKLQTRQYGGAVVLHCRGRLIFQREASELYRAISEMLPTTNAMVVDLAGVEAVDTAGLGELVLLHIWAAAAGFGLKFASPNRYVRQLMERTNLISVFDVCPSVAEAVAVIAREQAHSA